MNYYQRMLGLKAGSGKNYIDTMTGGSKKPEEKPPQSIVPVAPVEAEIVGTIHDPIPVPQPCRRTDHEHDIAASNVGYPNEEFFDQRALRRMAEARSTGETIIEMNEVIARSGGHIKARSMEVSLTFGSELKLGDLLQGCLAILDFNRRRRRESPADILASLPRPAPQAYSRQALPAPPVQRLPHSR